jgi:hypothetical protein
MMFKDFDGKPYSFIVKAAAVVSKNLDVTIFRITMTKNNHQTEDFFNDNRSVDSSEIAILQKE